MQLIQLIEPTAIDIKNKMSELGEAIEHIQINSGIADIKNDVSGKISPNKKDTVSHTNESINGNNSIKEQLEDEVKDLNGIVKPNSDAQMLSIDNYNSETENNVSIDNESTAIGQSNGSLSLSEPLKITNSNLTNTTVDGNINVDNDTIDLNKNLNSSEKEEVIVDSNKGDSSLNVKEIPDVISSENLPSVIDTQAPASSEEVCVAEKLKGIEVSIENKNMAPNAPAFSPNSDTNEEVNISAQLQQLENDPSIEKGSIGDIIPDTDLKILTEIESNTFENKSQIKIEVPTFNNDKTTSPVKSEQNQILINSAEKKDTSGASEVDTKLPPIPDLDDKHEDDSIRMNMDLDIAPTDDKPDNNSDISFEGIPLVEKIPEDKSSMDVVNEDISNELSEKLVPVEAIVEQSTIESGIDMEVDDFKPNNEHKLESKREDKVDKPIDEKTLNSSKTENADVEKKASVQKYVTVKKFTDMAYPSAPTNGNVEATKNIEFTDILDGNLSQIDQNQQNQIMEVDATDKVFLITPEHGVTLYSSDKHSLVQKTEVENNIEITNKITIEDKTMEESSQDSIEKEVMTIEQQDIDSSVMEIDSAAMKINDSEIVPVVEKSKFDNVDQDKTEKTVAHNKISEKSKDNAVINIIDNEDEEPIKNNTQELSIMKNNNASEVISIDDSVKYAISEESHKPFTEVEIVNEADLNNVKEGKVQKNEKPVVKQLPVVCKLSNTMDILSDEEDDLHVAKPSEENKALNVNSNTVEEQNKCINLDDDDDIMFIEDTNSQDANLVEENKAEQLSDDKTKSQTIKTTDSKTDPDSAGNQINSNKSNSSKPPENEVPQIPQDSTVAIEVDRQPEVKEPKPVDQTETQETKPLITKSFLKSVTKNLADMTRNELEDFCILKLVESVVDKSNLNEIKNKMKTMAQTVEDLRKKTVALTKQNRDLQVVVKTVQEDQKKRSTNPMMPMKITRSVGMQVVLSVGEKSILKKKLSMPAQPPPNVPARPVRNMQSPKTQKPIANNIPVPRLVPASSPTAKSPATPVINTKPTAPPPRNTTPQKPEKRPHSKQSPASSVTVDLTDDEPPAKINTKNPTPPVRLVPSQSLMAPKNRPQFTQAGNSPRKVYIPISSSNPNLRPPQPTPTVLKNFIATPRPRQPSVVRMQTLRVNQLPPTSRHPAPLPDAMKQYQPPTWKALPPAPDLKLSKVDNGIVISWKFEGYQPDTYEEVASFQLYAYQETPAPPSTALWKKIGDIKALPLPMACTLTQFMSGFKYYFAVRAIDVRSRIGPFSLPGSIMLISKS